MIYRFLLKVLVILFSLISNPLLSQEIAINEIMSSNATTISDEDGDFEDWIELFNYGNDPINLTGYGLSDNYSSPFKWVFPEVTIQSGEYLLIWASGKNRNDANKTLHTNYSISSDGEEIILTSPDSQLIDEFPPTPILTDISYGRKPDGTGNRYFFKNPTPCSSNNTEGYSNIISPPVFSFPGGYYNEGFELTIFHSDKDAKIVYTIDGSEPSIDNLDGSTFEYKVQYRQFQNQQDGELYEREYISKKYKKPIIIENKTGTDETQTVINTMWEQEPVTPRESPLTGTVVRAKAYKDGYISSETVSNTYLIRNLPYPVSVISLILPEKSFFCYDEGIYVPGRRFDEWRQNNFHVNLHGSSPANFNNRGIEWEREANIEFFDNKGETQFNHRAGVRIHGGYSRSFPQKSLRLYARGRYGTNEFEHQLFPTKNTDVFKRFILRNSGNDHNLTFFRDALMQQMVKDRQIDMQHWEPVVTFLNGEYWGLLNIRDRVDKYFLHYKHGVDPENLDILEGNAQVKEGDNAHYNQMINYVENHNLNDPVHYEHVKTMIDVENFAEYYAIQIYVRNTDWPGNNIDFWRYRTEEYKPEAPYGYDGRWRWILFDLDFGFGIWGNGPWHNTLEFATQDDAPGWPNPPWSTNLFRNMIENQSFRINMINRFADLMNEAFHPDSVVKKIDKMQARYEPVITEHINRWTLIGSTSRWNDQIDIMRNFAVERPGYMRNHIEEFFDLEGNYELNVNIASGEGVIKINTIELENPSHWKGFYFNDVPIKIEAIELPGYEFSHWEGYSNSTSNSITISANEDINLSAHFSKIESSELINFWVFDSSMPNNTPLEIVENSYHAINQAEIIFYSALDGYPFTSDHPNWRKASMERRNAPIDINYHPEGNDGIDYGSANMRGLQIKQPFRDDGKENIMIINLPANGYRDLTFRFAAKDEGAADILLIDYSVDDTNENWTSENINPSALELTSDFQLYEIDFTGIPDANNNPNFKIRIRFDGEEMEADNGDRVTFNNISLDGKPMDDIYRPPQIINPISLKKAIEEGNVITIDLNDIFEDPDGDALSFIANSLRPEIVEVSLNENILELTPLKRGDTKINISANNGNNPAIEHRFRVLVYPKAYTLNNGNFEFLSWDENNPELSYPENMLFLQSDTDDPDIRYPLLYAYHIDHNDYHSNDIETIGYPYNNTGRTRINGLGNDGLSFINTGRGRDLGGALVALNTKNMNHANLKWLGGTVLQNERIYGISLQYRLGIEGEFSDLIAQNEISQYLVNIDGHAKLMPTIKLPDAIMNQDYVQLLWKYYHIAGESGPRAQLRLDDIIIGTNFASDDAFINSFDFYEVTIDEININNETFVITVSIPKSFDITSLIPIIEISDRARIHPSPNDDGFYEPMDFTEPVEFSITPESGLIKNRYLVTVQHSSTETGIYKNTGNNKIYPNPANNIINVISDIMIESVEIIDMAGKVLYRHVEKETHNRIPVHNFDSGIFLLRIRTKDDVRVKKVQIIN